MRIKNIIISLSILAFSSCVTIPDLPQNESPECIAHHFEVKAQLKELSTSQWNVTGVFIYFTFMVGFGIGADGFYVLTGLPYFLYLNYQKANSIEEEYQKTYCKKK